MNLAEKYPGLSEKIRKAYDAGYTDDMIMENVRRKVFQARGNNYTDDMIRANLGIDDLSEFDTQEPSHTWEGIKGAVTGTAREVKEGTQATIRDMLQGLQNLPEAVGQTGRGVGQGLASFLLGHLAYPYDVARQVIGKGDIDWEQAEGAKREVEEELAYEPTNPAARRLLEAIGSVPAGIELAGTQLADVTAEHLPQKVVLPGPIASPPVAADKSDVAATIKTLGDLFSLHAFGEVFKGVKTAARIKPKEVLDTAGIQRDVATLEKAESEARAQKPAEEKILAEKIEADMKKKAEVEAGIRAEQAVKGAELFKKYPDLARQVQSDPAGRWLSEQQKADIEQAFGPKERRFLPENLFRAAKEHLEKKEPPGGIESAEPVAPLKPPEPPGPIEPPPEPLVEPAVEPGIESVEAAPPRRGKETKPPPVKGRQNLHARIMRMGGLKDTGYEGEVKHLKQNVTNKKIFNNKKGLTLDEVAQTLKNEGYPIEDANHLIETLKTNRGGEIYSKSFADEIIEHKARQEAGAGWDRAAAEEAEYLREHPESARELEEALSKNERNLYDFFDDVNTALGERGSVVGKPTAEQKAARARLKADLDRLELEAKKLGLNIEEYLARQGLDKEATARLLTVRQEPKIEPVEAFELPARAVTAKSKASHTVMESPDWKAAKKGDQAAANRIIEELWTEKKAEALKEQLESPEDSLVISQPSTTLGNVIPLQLAKKIAADLRAEFSAGRDHFEALHRTESKKIPRYQRPYRPRKYKPVDPDKLKALAGDKEIVVVEDVLTTAGSAAQFVRALQKEGLKVRTVAALMGDPRLRVDPNTQHKLSKALKRADIPIRSVDLAKNLTRSEAGSIIQQLNQARTENAKQKLTENLSRLSDQRAPEPLTEAARRRGASRDLRVDDRGDVIPGKEVSPDAGRPRRTPRRIKDIIRDVNIVLGEKGAIGSRDLTAEQRQATKALRNDLSILEQRAKDAGLSLDGYMERIGLPEDTRKYLRILKTIKKPTELEAGLKEPPPTEMPKYAQSINLERLETTDDVKNLIVELSKDRPEEIDAQRRGVITHRATETLAEDLGMTPEELIKTKKGTAYNAEQAIAARQILATSAKEVQSLWEKQRKAPTEENLLVFRIALEKHAEIQKAVSGIATEAGRALSSFRIMAKETARREREIKNMLDALGGREITEEIAKKFAEIDHADPAQVNTFIREAMKAKTLDMVFEAWVNGLLSGPQTHAVNSISNTLVFLSRYPEKTIEAGTDLMRATFTGSKREVYLGEVAADAFGIVEGVKTGVQRALQAWKTEMPAGGELSKLEVQRYRAIPGKTGKAVRMPGRALMAADEFFKGVNYSCKLYAEAYRQAVKKGARGKARAKWIAALIKDPTEAMVEAAKAEAEYRTFTKPLGKAGAKIGLVRTIPGAQYIIPFLRTPVNIAKYGLERTPLNFLRIAYKQIGKESRMGGARLSEELARATFGTMVGLAVFLAAREGRITGGGPSDRKKRAALYRTGWQPYSIKIGDEYYGYGRLEPLGMVIGTAADFAETFDEMNDRQRGNVVTKVGQSISKNLTSKTWTRGVSDVLEAVNDPDRYGKRYVLRFAGTAVPTGAAQVARLQDPTYKDPDNIVETLKSRVPGLIKDVRPRRNLWGEPIVGKGAVWPGGISKETDDAVSREMVRLEHYKDQPRDTITIAKTKIELDADEYNAYLEASGKMTKKALELLIKTREYKSAPDERKIRMFDRIYDKAREGQRYLFAIKVLKERKAR